MLTAKPSGKIVEIESTTTLFAYLVRSRVDRTHRAVRVGRRVSLRITDRAVCVLSVVFH